jgi:hypothetical protein
VTIFSEGFEVNTVPGSVWSATDANSTSGLDYWGDQSSSSGARVHGGSWSAYCADYSDRAGQQYDNNMQADMTLISAINLTGYTSVTFSFWLYHSRYNGSSWVMQQRWTSNTGGWVNPTYSVTGSSLRFRFYFYSNSSNRGEGSYVDDILVVGTPALLQNNGEEVALTLLREEGDLPDARALAEKASGGSITAPALRVAPNPVQGAGTLSFVLGSASSIRVEIFSPAGRRVATVADRSLPAGDHQISWSPASLPAGIYYARLLVNGEPRSSTRVTVLR